MKWRPLELDPLKPGRAILIGVDRYPEGVPPLRTATADVRAVAALLREQHDFPDPQILLDEQATPANVRAALRALQREVDEDDRVLVYFAGHGKYETAKDDPLPQGSLQLYSATVAEGALPTAELLAELVPEKLRCRHLLVLLDCCYAGAAPFAARDGLSAPRRTHYREQYEYDLSHRARYLLVSAAHNERALDHSEGQGHSPFADALLRGLSGAADIVWPGEGNDGLITAAELHVFLAQALRQVHAHTHFVQHPALLPLDRRNRGEFLFWTPNAPRGAGQIAQDQLGDASAQD